MFVYVDTSAEGITSMLDGWWRNIKNLIVIYYSYDW